MGSYRGSTVAFAAAYVVLVVGLFLALGGLAYAAGPSAASDQYDTKVETVPVLKPPRTTQTAAAVTKSAPQETAAVQQPVAVSASQSLPNTGLSLLGVVAVGGGLVAAGVVLRRRERGRR